VAKAIYSRKIFMFQHQFTLTAKEKNNVHLCFFPEILVGLSFFDDIIDADVKRKMVANLKLPPSKECMKRLHGSLHKFDLHPVFA